MFRATDKGSPQSLNGDAGPTMKGSPEEDGRSMFDATKPIVTLLIIDDNLGSLEMLSSALAQPNLEILTASDPEVGLDIACSAILRLSLRTSSCLS